MQTIVFHVTQHLRILGRDWDILLPDALANLRQVYRSFACQIEPGDLPYSERKQAESSQHVPAANIQNRAPMQVSTEVGNDSRDGEIMCVYRVSFFRHECHDLVKIAC